MTTVDPCPECDSHDVRLVWVATEKDDYDSWVCQDCGHRWIS